MNERKALDLGVSDAGCGSICVKATSRNLEAQYEYYSHEAGADVTGCIRFEGVAAYRFRGEMHSLGSAEGSYDTLVEIETSDWLHELLSKEPSHIWGSVRRKKHFAVFFSNNGYLEVIADDFAQLPVQEGNAPP